MENTAKAVMQTRFKTLSPDHTIKQAVRSLQSASKEYGRRVFGMMVTDEKGNLFVQRKDSDGIAGVISLTDAALVRSGSCRACTASRFLTPHM